MKTRAEVTSQKLRGGFYSPDPLVHRCLERVAQLVGGRTSLRVLEPSAGDGAFVRGIARCEALAPAVAAVVAIEPDVDEAAKCLRALDDGHLAGHVVTDSAIAWAATTHETFDCAVGNPPYLRFQFLGEDDKRRLPELERRAGVSFSGVTNLWIPLLIGALGRLDVGGAFAFIVPTECFTGVSAGVLRTWLVRNTEHLRFDLFPSGSFPGALQEVTILSGTRRDPVDTCARCELHEHPATGRSTATTHLIPPSPRPWTRYLLTPAQVDAFEEASQLTAVVPLGQVAKFEVAAVTGANGFFTVDASTVRAFDLWRWTTPLVPRIRHARGLRYTTADSACTEAAGARAFLLDFALDRPDPTCNADALRYLESGARDGLPQRYKCRIREPWYRVPSIRAGRLMMSKRSHRGPRVVRNDAGVVTTDTIYRGAMVGAFDGRDCDLVAAFHGSLTMLSAEIEGRSFGGGVLELVPSEVARLVVAMPQGFGVELDRLDAVARTAASDPCGIDVLVDETDRLLVEADFGMTSELAGTLREARAALLQRRLDRNT